MIKNPISIVIFLLLIEIFVLYISEHKDFKKYFSFLPAVFWIYFLPMLSSTIGLVDAQSPIYQKITTYILPASLFLLLITVDVKAILKLGRPALMMFFAGSFGIIFGTVVVFALFKNFVGADMWSGFGALSASWTGGSANMIAVKEAIHTPDAVFTPMVIVDTIVPYVWMGFLVAMSSGQALYDRWNRSDRRILDQLSRKAHSVSVSIRKEWRLDKVILILIFAVLASLLTQTVAKFLPVIKDVISTYAWTIIIITALGIGLSLTRVKKLENFHASSIGYFLLYFVLTTIGAKASLSNIGATIFLIVAGFLIVIIHSSVLVLVAWLIRAPMFLVATASQANIGGVASTPIVAEIYQPGLASVGLLLAILGNIIGTYLGILTSQICRFMAHIP